MIVIEYPTHRYMARGGHGLPKFTPRATKLYASMLFQGWPARRLGSLWSSSTLLDTPRRSPNAMF
jgi:hypothetical protein